MKWYKLFMIQWRMKTDDDIKREIFLFLFIYQLLSFLFTLWAGSTLSLVLQHVFYSYNSRLLKLCL